MSATATPELDDLSVSPLLTTFFDNLDSFAEAPEGVAKLREMILDLAVRGKLVEQDENDEPASEFLHAIFARKQQLVDAKEIPKQKTLPEIDADNVPFQIPDQWEWIRLESVCEVITKGSSPKWQGVNYVYDGDGVLFVTSENVGVYTLRKMDEPKFVEHKFNDMESRSILRRGDILVNLVGASIGRSALWDRDDVANINQAVGIVRLVPGAESLDRSYLLHYLNSSECLAIMFENQVATARANISLTNVKHFLVPVAPLSEQRRIVSTVDGLMSLCDELESRGSERARMRERASRSCLERLMSSSSQSDLASAWQRLSDHFEVLFDTAGTLPYLRQSILQLAVQGKLVPQDPNDEPAEALANRIAESKELQVEQTSIRNTSAISSVDGDSAPHPSPPGWKWLRLGDFGVYYGGGTPSKTNSAFWDGPIPWVSPKDMKRPYIDDAMDHVSELAIENSSARLIPTGSLLMVIRGMILAHSFPVAIAMRPLAINQDMKALAIAQSEVTDWLLLVCQADKTRMLENVLRSSHGTCRIASESVAEFPIPLPPLAEQKRIVAKVDQLLSHCDELSRRLEERQSATQQLLTATTHTILDKSKN